MGNYLGEVGGSSDDINTPSVQNKASVVSPRLLGGPASGGDLAQSYQKPGYKK